MTKKRDFRKTFSVTDEFMDVREFIVKLEESKENKSRIICSALRAYINNEVGLEAEIQKLNKKFDSFISVNNAKLDNISTKIDKKMFSKSMIVVPSDNKNSDFSEEVGEEEFAKSLSSQFSLDDD